MAISFKSIQFDPIDIWAEIRGIIKGYMGINGFRKEEFDKDLIEQKHLISCTKIN